MGFRLVRKTCARVFAATLLLAVPRAALASANHGLDGIIENLGSDAIVNMFMGWDLAGCLGTDEEVEQDWYGANGM